MHILDYSFQSKSFIQYFAISTECIGRLLAIPFVIHLDISMYIGTYINFDCAQFDSMLILFKSNTPYFILNKVIIWNISELYSLLFERH